MTKQFTIYTDASSTGIGAALCQIKEDKIHLIQWISRRFLPREKNYTFTEKECLSVVWAIQKFSPFLHQKFILRNDLQALKWLLAQKEAKKRLARWIMKISSFDYEFQHVKGKENQIADALSRGVVKMYKCEAKER